MLDALPVLQLLLCLCAESSEHANAQDPRGCSWLEVQIIMLLEHFVSFELWGRAFEETTKDMPRQRVAWRVWDFRGKFRSGATPVALAGLGVRDVRERLVARRRHGVSLRNTNETPPHKPIFIIRNRFYY